MITMATKSTTPKATPAADDAPAVADVVAPDPTVCVVNDGRCVGKAVNGAVCSYHAVWYDREGNRR